MKPAVGHIVHFIVGRTPDMVAIVRPAIVTQVWSDSMVNLQVFPDGANDRDRTLANGHPVFATPEINAGIAWRTSASFGAMAGDWFWPSRG